MSQQCVNFHLNDLLKDTFAGRKVHTVLGQLYNWIKNMSTIKKGPEEKRIGLERLLTRHESWKNHRRYKGLKLIRFS